MKKKLNRKIPQTGLRVKEQVAHRDDILGLWDPSELTISIRPDLEWVEKNVTLLHELLHVCDQGIKNSGFRKTCISHLWISQAAWILLHLLVELGVYRGVSKKELRQFIKDNFHLSKDGMLSKKKGSKVKGVGRKRKNGC